MANTRYSINMKFAKVTNAPKPRVKAAQNVAIAYAVLLIIVTMSQLFKFEDFFPIFSGYSSSITPAWAAFIGSAAVFVEVFAVPALIRMPLSKLFRYMSYVFAVVAPLFWLVFVFVGALSGYDGNSGLFGATLKVHVGVAPVVISGALLALATYSVYGLQGAKPHHK